MSLGLLAALAAAVLYGAATVVQAVGVRRFADLPEGTGLVLRARAGWLYGLGLVLDLLGFAVSVLALRTLPLFLVESAVASSVGVTAVLAALVLGVRLGAREVATLTGLLAGLVLLAVTAQDGPARVLPSWVGWVVLAGVAPVAALLVAARGERGRSVVPLSVAAGLGFGGVGVAARLLAIDGWRTLAHPELYAIAGYGLVATAGYALALERGRTTTVAAITFAVETVVPAAIGLVWLGDQVRPGLPVVAGLGFVLALGCCVLLARHAEPAAQPDRADRADPA